MAEKIISNISNLVEFLRDDISNYDEDVWFRGQSDFNWKLEPGIFRCSQKMSESSLLTRFKQSAAMLTNSFPKSDFDWLFLMQHYGVPTRLLDWSESPLTSLYFAISENNTSDAALWLLKPIELNKIANISTLEKNFIPSFEDTELDNYKVETLRSNTRNKLAPIATIATRNSTRIQAQLGVFTIHHLDQRSIEEFCSPKELIKYRIPATSKNVIREELSLLGVNKFSLFPELASIGEILKNKLL
ncbi:FRG domain-containing protein [Flavobacterium hydatis]|uniref:FRG domain-containing protein n=1 Tax=Flavobacterium hydatis TaxID=991 RepID=A0A085ZCS0_FLAHY|nr:FRG domain-containing protein [Flavobacterium hydatis]KFF02234.1 hypothetical protein IW20_25300 [Flavobacterium hydatis]OXA84576.1 FRG domain-containing protein [Flavobacterium hydatis]